MRRTDSLEKHWCWERSKAGGEGDDRGGDGWMASLTQWTWVWAGSRRYWWTGRPGGLQSMGSLRVGHNWATELNLVPEIVVQKLDAGGRMSELKSLLKPLESHVILGMTSLSFSIFIWKNKNTIVLILQGLCKGFLRHAYEVCSIMFPAKIRNIARMSSHHCLSASYWKS